MELILNNIDLGGGWYANIKYDRPNDILIEEKWHESNTEDIETTDSPLSELDVTALYGDEYGEQILDAIEGNETNIKNSAIDTITTCIKENCHYVVKENDREVNRIRDLHKYNKLDDYDYGETQKIYSTLDICFNTKNDMNVGIEVESELWVVRHKDDYDFRFNNIEIDEKSILLWAEDKDGEFLMAEKIDDIDQTKATFIKDNVIKLLKPIFDNR